MTQTLQNVNIRGKELTQVQRVNNLVNSHRNVLNALIRFTLTYQEVFPSHKALSMMADCSPKTVERAIKALRDEKWIETKRRFNNTLLYKVNPTLFSIDTRASLRHLLPNLFFLPIRLIAPPRQGRLPSVGLMYYIGLRNLNNNKYTSVKKSLTSITKQLAKQRRNKQYLTTEFKVIESYLTVAAKELAKRLNLTNQGEIFLAAMPPQIIENVLAYVKTFGASIGNKWGYVVKCILNEAQRQGIKIDWRLFYILKELIEPFTQPFQRAFFKHARQFKDKTKKLKREVTTDLQTVTGYAKGMSKKEIIEKYAWKPS